MIRTYTELSQIDSFLERFRYLRLGGGVGQETFGFDRYLNQVFYRSKEWKKLRNDIIVRDFGCDLGIRDREIVGRILIHHMNPITEEDILRRRDWILNPEFLVCTAFSTHNAIHYGDESLLMFAPVERSPNDTTPWR